MKLLFPVLLLLLALPATAQKQTFDLVTYAPVKGWKKATSENVTTMSYTDPKDKSWCQISIYKSVDSKGTIATDFETGWNALVAKPYHITAAPQTSAIEEAEGWQIQSGSGQFLFNKKNAVALLTTFSGHGKSIYILATTANQRYLQDIQNFTGTLELSIPATNNTAPVITQTTPPANNSGFTFSTTNFDDGWTSTIQEDWVQVTKNSGGVKVLLHYAKEGTIFPADPELLTNAAWNILVAPRYSNLSNYKTTYVNSYESATIASGYATDKASGQAVYLVFFRQAATGWIEFIATDKQQFIQFFKADIDAIRWDSDADLLKPMTRMITYNKFAVAATDLKGKWSDHFTSNTYYANMYTGMSAGMSTYSSSQYFEFGNHQTYKWEMIAANTYGGSTNVFKAKGAGSFKSVNNWQLYFLELEGKPKTYDAYFTAMKGGRILWMNDANYPGSGVFTGFTPEKK